MNESCHTCWKDMSHIWITRDMPHSRMLPGETFVWCVYVTRLIIYVTWLIIYVTWLIHVCYLVKHVFHVYVWHYSLCMWHDSFTYVTWLIHICYMWHGSFIYVTNLGIHMFDKKLTFPEVQPIAFGVSFNHNLQSQSHWSLFNGTWQKRPRELDSRLRFEIQEMTL